MSHKFLIAYATRTGTTTEIAETIAKTLAARGETVEVLPVQDVTDLSRYDGVLLGSAVRFGQWLPEAQKFVEAHRRDLSQRPTAIFTVHGLNLGDDETSRTQRQAYLTQVRNFVQAKTEGFFAGKIDTSKLKFFERVLAKALKATGASRLDLDAVRSWTEDAYSKLLATGQA
jgi:menaquinone-dependent protoporphyrinogen oxidase